MFVKMSNPSTGESKTIDIGFSWTLLFFSGVMGIPLFLRKLHVWGTVMLIIWAVVNLLLPFSMSVLILPIWMGLTIYLGAVGNKLTAINYLKLGWVFDDSERNIKYAKMVWQIHSSADFDGERSLTSDAYRLWLADRYQLHRNAFDRFVTGERTFETLDAALAYCYDIEAAKFERDKLDQERAAAEQERNAAERAVRASERTELDKHNNDKVTYISLFLIASFIGFIFFAELFPGDEKHSETNIYTDKNIQSSNIPINIGDEVDCDNYVSNYYWKCDGFGLKFKGDETYNILLFTKGRQNIIAVARPNKRTESGGILTSTVLDVWQIDINSGFSLLGCSPPFNDEYVYLTSLGDTSNHIVESFYFNGKKIFIQDWKDDSGNKCNWEFEI